MRGDEAICLGTFQATGIGKPLLICLILLDVLLRFRRSDRHHQIGMAIGGFPWFFQSDARGGFLRKMHVLDNLVPTDQLAVGTHREPGELFWSGQLLAEQGGCDE